MVAASTAAVKENPNLSTLQCSSSSSSNIFVVVVCACVLNTQSGSSVIFHGAGFTLSYYSLNKQHRLCVSLSLSLFYILFHFVQSIIEHIEAASLTFKYTSIPSISMTSISLSSTYFSVSFSDPFHGSVWQSFYYVLPSSTVQRVR